MRYLVFVIVFITFNPSVHAQIYKWLDENGNTQYSDQPPVSSNVQQEQRLRINAPPVTLTSQASGAENNNGAVKPTTLADERSAYDKRRQERLEKEVEKKARLAENKQKCIDAQSRLRVFLESPRLRVPDGQGGLTYVDDNVRDQKIKEANDAVTTYCK